MTLPKKQNRKLTEMELKVYRRLVLLEEAIDKRWLAVQVIENQKAAEIVCQHFKLLAMQHDEAKKQYCLIFTLREYKRYTDALCRYVGFRIDIDGTIWTKDDLFIKPPEPTA